ncbi:MAG: hypothetical protein QM750_20020 [Rubrivivax sp.]
MGARGFSGRTLITTWKGSFMNASTICRAAAAFALALPAAPPSPASAQPAPAAPLAPHDFECLGQLAQASPTAVLAVARVAAHCAVAPTTGVTAWLARTSLVQDMSSALAQRINPGTAPDESFRAMPGIPVEICTTLRTLPAAGPAAQCEFPDLRGKGAAHTTAADYGSRCDKAIASAPGLRLAGPARPAAVVLRTPDTVVCNKTVELLRPKRAHYRVWTEARVTLDARTLEVRGIELPWELAAPRRDVP